MKNEFAGRPGRGGITIDHRGTQRTLGYWPAKFDSATGWLGQLRTQFGEAVRIAQRHHMQNETVRIAKFAKKPVNMPEPSVRQALAREEQKKLAQVDAAVGKISEQVFKARMDLKPFEYSKGGIIGALNRQELRATLRKMTQKQRNEALGSYIYREAALELRPEQAGLQQPQYDDLYRAELETKFPDVMAGTADATEAMEIVSLAVKTAREAVEAELLASGGTIEDPKMAMTQPAWA